MKSSNIVYAASLLVLMFVATGCKKFLDINENPNLPQEGSIELLLPSAQAAVGFVVGGPFQIHGALWAQHWTQNPFSSQYRSIEQYSVTTTSFDRPWRILYSDALQDLQVIINNAQGQAQYSQHAAIAHILKGYAFQVATDAFGDIPLTEALNPEITSPKYNTQEQVYDSIVQYVQTGLSMIDETSTTVPGAEDLIFGGDMNQWKRFANTLLLRMYLRQSQVRPDVARAGIQALSGAEFLETDAKIDYSTTGGNQNPLFAEILGLGRTQNVVASETVTKFLTNNRDPRADVFFQRYQADAVDTIIGIPQGSYRTTTEEFSIPSAATGASGLEDESGRAPVRFISAAESYFLQAEAAVRGWLTTGESPAELFEKGIRSSFESFDVEGVEAYLQNSPAAQFPAGTEARIRAIITQKWVAMTGNQSFEAWTEWRRTGYPEFFTVSEATALGDDRMPARLLYPASEVTRNVNFETNPGLKQVFEPMWWDVEG